MMTHLTNEEFVRYHYTTNDEVLREAIMRLEHAMYVPNEAARSAIIALLDESVNNINAAVNKLEMEDA